jgi:hypothetical protein
LQSPGRPSPFGLRLIIATSRTYGLRVHDCSTHRAVLVRWEIDRGGLRRGQRLVGVGVAGLRFRRARRWR